MSGLRGRPRQKVIRDKTYLLRLSQEEFERYREAAEKLGVPLATWLRLVADKATGGRGR